MTTHYPKYRDQAGFTLVELLIVAIILAILAAIVVPQFASSTDDAQSSALRSNLAGIRSAIDLYTQQHGGTFPGAVAASGGRCPRAVALEQLHLEAVIGGAGAEGAVFVGGGDLGARSKVDVGGTEQRHLGRIGQ